MDKHRGRIFFVSDVHLSFRKDDAERKKQEKFIRFLDHVSQEGGELYILGDLFDFWFEWYHVVLKHWFPILFKLRSLVNQGIAVHFITGNHDFHFGDYLEKDIGLHCIDGDCSFELEGKSFYCAHGDGFARQDRAYRLLKAVIRNPLSIFMFKTFIPADIGAWLAKISSKGSRGKQKQPSSAWIEDYVRFAERKFSQGVDFVVLGHNHTASIEKRDSHVYVHCGGWMKGKSSYALYEEGQLTLQRWE